MLTFTVVLANKTPPLPKPATVPSPGLPISGGIMYLLASGVALGVYTLKKKK
jgi:hypothetical protein